MIHILSCVGCFTLPDESESDGLNFRTISEVAERIDKINQIFQSFAAKKLLTDSERATLSELQVEKRDLQRQLIYPSEQFIESNRQSIRSAFKSKSD